MLHHDRPEAEPLQASMIMLRCSGKSRAVLLIIAVFIILF